MGQEVSTQEDWDRPRFGTPEKHKVCFTCCRCLFARLCFCCARKLQCLLAGGRERLLVCLNTKNERLQRCIVAVCMHCSLCYSLLNA